MEHICVNKELIEKIQNKLEGVIIEQAVQKSSISGIKDDVTGIKTEVKEISAKMDSGFKAIDNKVNEGFKAIDKWLIGLLVTILLSSAGMATTIILFLANNKK